jgi:anti-anti-sigma factor
MASDAKNVQFLAVASLGRSWIMIDTGCSWQTSLSSWEPPAITVTLNRQAHDTTVCTVVGTVDWNTRALLRNALVEAGQDDNVHLVIDLSAVTFMDSAGPYTLLEARFRHGLEGAGHLAVVADPNSSAIPELQSVAIWAAFDVHPTLTDALHACARTGTPTATPH